MGNAVSGGGGGVPYWDQGTIGKQNFKETYGATAQGAVRQLDQHSSTAKISTMIREDVKMQGLPKGITKAFTGEDPAKAVEKKIANANRNAGWAKTFGLTSLQKKYESRAEKIGAMKENIINKGLEAGSGKIHDLANKLMTQDQGMMTDHINAVHQILHDSGL